MFSQGTPGCIKPADGDLWQAEGVPSTKVSGQVVRARGWRGGGGRHTMIHPPDVIWVYVLCMKMTQVLVNVLFQNWDASYI